MGIEEWSLIFGITETGFKLSNPVGIQKRISNAAGSTALNFLPLL